MEPVRRLDWHNVVSSVTGQRERLGSQGASLAIGSHFARMKTALDKTKSKHNNSAPLSNHADNIPAGTQVVSLIEVRGTNNSLMHNENQTGGF